MTGLPESRAGPQSGLSTFPIQFRFKPLMWGRLFLLRRWGYHLPAGSFCGGKHQTNMPLPADYSGNQLSFFLEHLPMVILCGQAIPMQTIWMLAFIAWIPETGNGIRSNMAGQLGSGILERFHSGIGIKQCRLFYAKCHLCIGHLWTGPTQKDRSNRGQFGRPGH